MADVSWIVRPTHWRILPAGELGGDPGGRIIQIAAWPSSRSFPRCSVARGPAASSDNSWVVLRARRKTPRVPPHTGFNVDRSVRVQAGDQAGIERLAQYMARSPFSLARLIRITPAGKVLYKTEKDRMHRFPNPASRAVYPRPAQGEDPDRRTGERGVEEGRAERQDRYATFRADQGG
jgi:hypothetical protein